MAGKFRISNGSMVEFDNLSGHYTPNGSGAESVARDALNRNGFNAAEAEWKPWQYSQ